MIAAVDEKGGIGKNNRLPWHLPSDLKRFKQLTMGHHLLMGRKTYESIGRSLPGRIMLVVSHRHDFAIEGVVVQTSLESAIQYAEAMGENELFIIGGGQIFAEGIKLADRIYLTRVHTDSGADVFFPSINGDGWQVITTQAGEQASGDEYASDFTVLEREH